MSGSCSTLFRLQPKHTACSRAQRRLCCGCSGGSALLTSHLQHQGDGRNERPRCLRARTHRCEITALADCRVNPGCAVLFVSPICNKICSMQPPTHAHTSVSTHTRSHATPPGPAQTERSNCSWGVCWLPVGSSNTAGVCRRQVSPSPLTITFNHGVMSPDRRKLISLAS